MILVTKYFRRWILFLARKTFSDETISSLKDFEKKSNQTFSDENFRRYMCLDFLKNSFSDEFFRHYMYPKIVLLMKLFVTKYVLINWNGFCDENFCCYMCLDFLKNSFSDELFHHYMYPKRVLVTKLFVTE